MSKRAKFTIDGEPATISKIKKASRNDTLEEELGDYVTAREIHKIWGVIDTTLKKGKRSGQIRTKQIGSTTFYSKQDLLDFIKPSAKRT
jgi:hypothetical protein